MRPTENRIMAVELADGPWSVTKNDPDRIPSVALRLLAILFTFKENQDRGI
jgi:hypothetical protein